MTKKIIAILLLLCMIISLLPGAGAFADNEPSEDNTGTEDCGMVIEDTVSDTETAEDAAFAGEAEEDNEELPLESVLTSDFYVEANEEAGLEGNILVDMDLLGCTGRLFLPGCADAAMLRFCWDDSSIRVAVGDTVYESGTAPVPAVGESITYTLTKSYAVAFVTIETLQGSEGIRPMFIDIDESLGTIEAMNSDDEHETSCFGSIRIDGEEYIMSIKGRGNSTWVFEKKPYNITFYKKDSYTDKKKVSLIDGVKSKKWSILSNYLDSSLMRNKLAFDLACDLGIGLESDFIDVYMNGEYCGSYLLCPKKDYDCADDGFIIENDHIDEPSSGEQFVFPNIAEMPLKHNRINVDDIGDDAAAAGWDINRIEEWFTEAWNSVLDTDSEEYQKYFDLESWAKMYLMFEVSKTYDCYAGNIMMHRDGIGEGDLLYAGPVWDYDIAFGRTLHKFLVGMEESVQINAEGWFNDSVGFAISSEPYSILQGLGMHKSFIRRVSEIYNEYKADFEALGSDVDALRGRLIASAHMDNAKWGANHIGGDYLVSSTAMNLMGTGEYRLNYEQTFGWDNYVNNLREFCTKRVMWLSDHLSAEAPVGEIVQNINGETGEVELKVSLTAGSGSNTFQWQSSADGKAWSDIEGAVSAKLILSSEQALSGLRYRCIVTNEGTAIRMNHCKNVNASVKTALDGVEVNAVSVVVYKETSIQNGTFTLVMDGRNMGEYTVAASKNGWTLRSENGRYAAASGTELVLSPKPFVWLYNNGVFSANVKVSTTAIGRMLNIGRQRTVYLTVLNGSPAVSLSRGAKATFLQTTAVLSPND